MNDFTKNELLLLRRLLQEKFMLSDDEIDFLLKVHNMIANYFEHPERITTDERY